MPIFGVKSVKIYTGQFFLHRHVCGVCDKYEVCKSAKSLWNTKGAKKHKTQSCILPEALKKGTIEESSGEVKKEQEN